jgi:predicted SprT family Zn-dependent metalloprotease
MSQQPVPLSTDRLQSRWSDLNIRFFRSALPPIDIAWSLRLTASSGMFVSHVGPCPRNLSSLLQRRLIRLSIPLLRDQPEEEIIRTLAHEMIHQWQFDVLKRRPNHGADFQRMKEVLNRAGYGITVRHDLESAVLSFSRYAWRCVRCGTGYHRQRRTIRPAVHRCGVCRGRLREIAVQLKLLY